MASKAERFKARLKSISDSAKEQTEHVVRGVVTVGVAGGCSYARTRYGENGRLLVAGVDLDLLLGLGLHGVGFFVGGKGGSAHLTRVALHSGGDGALSCYVVNKMAELGQEGKDRAAGYAPRQMRAAGHGVGNVMRSSLDRAAAQGAV